MIEGYSISTDKKRIQLEVVQKYLSEESYWAKGRSIEKTKTAIEHSICFSVFKGDTQIGFARVVSDRSTFAYIADVFVIKEQQGKGIGKMLMNEILSHPELQDLRRWLLATKDAHGLYRHSGFESLSMPERWMEIYVKG